MVLMPILNYTTCTFLHFLQQILPSDGFSWTMIIFMRTVECGRPCRLTCAWHDLLIFFGDTLVASNERNRSGQE